MSYLSRIAVATLLVLLTALTVACGRSNPAAPTDPSSPPVSGAIIQGTVLGASASARSADSTGGSMTVSVVGTNITVSVGLTGQFTITVPSGDITLKFHGAGGDATLQIVQVKEGDTITITVTIQGTTAATETETRASADHQQQVEGRIEAIDTAAKSLVVGGKTILTNTSTVLRHGNDSYSFADLQVGWRVHVAGTPATGGVLASTIEVQNTNGDIQVNVNGTVQALQGTASAFQFTVDGRLVKGDTATAFTKGAFASLHNGSRVEVKGQQQNGYVYAKTIHVN
jgi:hypothetical protein